MEATTPEERVGDVIAVLARSLADRRDELEGELLALMREQIKPLSPDARLLSLLQVSITDNVGAVLRFLETKGNEEEIEPSAGVIAHARALAQRDIPLSALIRAYRIGHARLLDVAMRFAAHTIAEEHRTEVLIDLVNRAALFIDRTCEQVGLAYEQERDRWVSSRSGLRQRWAEQVLNESAVDLRQASSILGYEFDGYHLAAQAWCEQTLPTERAVLLFDQLRGRLAQVLHCRRSPLMVPVDEHEVRLWFPLSASATIDMAAVRREVGSSQLRLALGALEAGVEGFRRSLRQATAAKEIGVIAPDRAGHTIAYQDVALLTLMTSDLDALRHFVVTALGALANDTERAERLRETLRVFLACNRSFTATAEELNLHRNSVQYRITQALEMCSTQQKGQPLQPRLPGESTVNTTTSDKAGSDGGGVRNLDTAVALTACHWLGTAVLRHVED